MATGIIMNSGRFYWNVEANVGLGSPNKTEDVQLVQLGFFCKGTNPKSTMSAADRAVYTAVVPGAMYTGSPNDPLSVAIKLFQARRGTVQDGHVSKINPVGIYGEHAYMLIGLNNNIFDTLGQTDWPYIDRHPKCPKNLKDVVARTFIIPPGPSA